MMQRFAVTLMLALTPAAASANQHLPTIDDAMGKLVEGGEFAGMAIELWHDGVLVHENAIGLRDLATAAPMTRDTIVRAFSMTKPVTAVALMILRDQGKWRPEDPVVKFLPELASPKIFEGLDRDGKPILVPAKSQPTMAELITNTAGFSYGFAPGWVDDRYREAGLWGAANLNDFVGKVARIPLAYEPGTQWRYSVSMDLEGAIVERISGMSLEAFMAKYIFAPLAMKDTGFFVPKEKLDRIAVVYDKRGGKLVPAANPLFNRDPSQPPGVQSGGGGLYTTADDYMRFGRMLLGEGVLDGRRIISRNAVREIMSNKISPRIVAGGFGVGAQWIRPGYAYGINGVVVTDPVKSNVALGKGTYLWDGMANTWFWVDPEHRIVFVGMVQRSSDNGGPSVQKVAQCAVAKTFYPDLLARLTGC